MTSKYDPGEQFDTIRDIREVMPPLEERWFQLDKNDPFEKVLVAMVETNRRKRKDYAEDESIFTNFAITSKFANFENRWLSALFNCQQKLARIQALRHNGRLNDPSNEAVYDTVLDNAVYAVIALAILEEDNNGEAPEA
jgi:hypothetical protein